MHNLKRVLLQDFWIGGTETDGTTWIIEDVTGWEDSNFRGTVSDRAWADGGWYDRQWQKYARFTLNVLIQCPTPEMLETKISTLKSIIPIRDPEAVTVDTSFTITQINARLEDSILVKRLGALAARVSIQFAGADPRRLSADVNGNLVWEYRETGLPASEGGLRFPFRFPFMFNARVISGGLDIEILGNAEASGKIVLTGPVKDPVIIDTVLNTTTRFYITLFEGQELVIDLDQKRVLLDGTADRRGVMAGPWPSLTPGLHSFYWSGDDGTPASLMKIQWVVATI